MPIKLSCYSVLLLTVFTTIAGCQTTAPLPSQDITQYENTMAMQADVLDSDGDGVPDDIDECPETLLNMVVDEKGCPLPVEILEYRGVEARVFFPENSSDPIASSYRGFDEFGKYLQNNNKEFLIEGHISTREKISGNMTLARTRAEFIKNYIVLNYGIDPKRFKVFEYSDTQPIASNDDPEGRKMNQRVMVTESRWSRINN